MDTHMDTWIHNIAIYVNTIIARREWSLFI